MASSNFQWADVWRSGTFFLYSCIAASESKKCRQDCLMSSAQSFYGSCLQFGSVLTYLLFSWECSTPPHVQIRHTTWLSFARPSPTLVVQATNTGMRRPGYEANWSCQWIGRSMGGLHPCRLWWSRLFLVHVFHPLIIFKLFHGTRTHQKWFPSTLQHNINIYVCETKKTDGKIVRVGIPVAGLTSF